jgi:uncharacterized protein YacL
MVRNLARSFITLVGISTGFGLGLLLEKLKLVETLFKLEYIDTITAVVVNVSLAIILGIIFFLSSSWIVKKIVGIADQTEKELVKIPFNQMLAGSIGLIVGLLIAYLLNPMIKNIVGDNVIYMIIIVGLYGLLGYLGVRLGSRNLADPSRLSEYIKMVPSRSLDKPTHQSMPKVLDTSVIIDGRIADICKTGFVEGKLVIAEFVLEELRHIADSSDSLKRTRGRRGLDILNIIQKELDVEVEITSQDFEDVNEVDIKLLKLAQLLNGAVVTNDFNLNKVAEIHGVKVLNINDLANAIKPVVLPGEDMQVMVVKEGKENHQGVAYLDDGTMIVVEDGRSLIGQDIQAVVTSVLQTSAGRMIFVKPKGKL